MAELKSMDELRKLAEKEIEEKNNKTEVAVPADDKNQTSVMDVVKDKENELLQSKEVQELGRRCGEERIKSDLAKEASDIRRRNVQTAESLYETETRELRLKHLRAQLNRQHKYEMDTLEQDARHTQMLNKRRKQVEKYLYLYNSAPDNMVEVLDGKGEKYSVPKDFSYSDFVNRFRQLGRNLSKLDKPILQTIKWALIIGAGIGIVFLLKRLGILN
jgi:hypothetical protein